MERAKVSKDEIVEQNVHFLSVYVESKNSCFVLLSENQDKLGTLAIAVPKQKDFLGPATSSILLGDRNVVSTRMFAEYIAAKKGKIALVSTYLERMDEIRAQSIFMKLIEKITRVEQEKEGVTT